MRIDRNATWEHQAQGFGRPPIFVPAGFLDGVSYTDISTLSDAWAVLLLNESGTVIRCADFVEQARRAASLG